MELNIAATAALKKLDLAAVVKYTFKLSAKWIARIKPIGFSKKDTNDQKTNKNAPKWFGGTAKWD